jgi:hypothetical protein
MCSNIMAHFLKIKLIQPLVFNFKYKLVCLSEICYSKIQIIQKHAFNTDIYYLFMYVFMLMSSVHNHSVDK